MTSTRKSTSSTARANDNGVGGSSNGEVDGVWSTLIEILAQFARSFPDLVSNKTADGGEGDRRLSPIKISAVLVFLILTLWLLNSWLKPFQERGVLLCNLNKGGHERYERGARVPYKPVFDHAIEIGGQELDHRLITKAGFDARFKPDQANDLDCDLLTDRRDQFADQLPENEIQSGACYIRARRTDFSVSVGAITKAALNSDLVRESENPDSRDIIRVVEVRRVGGTVEYLPTAKCNSKIEQAPPKMLTLQQSAQRWVDLWLNKSPFPRTLRERGITREPVDVYLVRRRDNRGEFVCHGRDVGGPTHLEKAACGILSEGQSEIMRRIDPSYYPMEKTKVIITIRDPQMEAAGVSAN